MKKKKKINKYTKRRIVAILVIIILIIIIKMLISLFGNKNKIPELSILFNNEFINTKKEVIIDEEKNIYFSKEDIQNLFDEMMYYNEAEGELITTYNTHVALLKIGDKNILINDNPTELKGKFEKINNILYLPIKDLQIVYDIELEYIEKNNRIIIESTLKEKKQGTVAKNTKLKEKKGIFKKTIENLAEGETVTVLETEKNYKKVRNSLGDIGYIKSNKIINENAIRENIKEEVYNIKVYKEYSNISGIYENISVDKEKLNVVTPTFFFLGKNSKVLDKTASSTATYANYTNWLKQNSLQILPTLENTESISNTLLTYNQRSQAINDLCAKLMNYQYKGININFENIDDINSFYRFIIEMKPKFKEAGLITCVTINDNIDKEKIEKIVDYIIEE